MSSVLWITSRDATYQRFETLKRNREKRAAQKLFFVEGVHPIERAVENEWRFFMIAHAEGARLSGWAEDMLRRAQAQNIVRVAPELMAELSDRSEACELIALVETRSDGLERMASARNPLYVLFDRPQSPGNLGTVIRSADAFGSSGLIVTGHAADLYDPQCIRASVGTLFTLPTALMESPASVLAWLDGLAQSVQIVGTSAKGDRLLSEVDFTKPTLLLIGNEATGLSRAWKERCDVLAKIPIHGAASSLNAGCAASICLYEAAGQRASI